MRVAEGSRFSFAGAVVEDGSEEGCVGLEVDCLRGREYLVDIRDVG